MFYVLQNESTAARRRVPILLTDAATGTTAQTGVAITNIYPYVNINGGAFAGGAGTVAEAGYGQYYYEMAPAEVATLGLAGIHVTAAGCRDYDAITQVAAFNMYSAAGAGITAGDVWEYDISGVITAGTAGSQLNVAAAGGGTTTGDIATAVWDYAGATVPATVKETLENAATSAANADSNTGSTQLRTAVWDFDIDSAGFNTSPPYAAGYLIAAGSGGGGITAYDVWNFDPTAMSSPQAGGVLYDSYLKANQAESNTQPSNLRPAVWDFDIDAAGFGTNPPFAAGYLINAGNGATTAGSQVWSYVTREITGGTATTVTNPVLVDPASMTGIANTVWNTDVSAFLTPSAGYDLTQAASATGITAFDVWNYTLTSSAQSADATLGNVDTNVTTIQGNTSNIPGDVWSYATRTLTSGAGATAGDIWDYAGGRTITGGIVTSVGDKTGYSLSGTQSFNLTGNITGNISGSVGSVTNPVDITTNAMSGTAGSVWSYVTRTLTSGGGATAGDIWSYGTRTITGGLANTVTDVTNPVSISGATMASIANSVWDDTVAAHTTNGTFGKLLLRSDAANKAGDVTLYSSGGVNGVDADMHRIANDTAAATALKNALTGIGASWTGNITGNVTGSVNSVTNDVNVSTTSMSGIAGTVWSYVTRTLTSGGGVTAGDVWSYGTRTITGGTIDTNNDKTGYALSTAGVNAVQSGLSTLTQAQVGTEVDSSLADVGLTTTVTGRIDTAISTRLAASSYTAPPTEASIAGTVWSYVTRTLTSGSGITAGDVWSYATRTTTGGVVDTNNDKTGYSLTGTQSFNLTGNITGNLSGSVGSVTNPVSVSTASMSGIAQTAWTYSPRTLTSGAGATAGDIWTYNISAITTSGTAGKQLNDAAVSGSVVTIVNGPYKLTSIAEGIDGKIDILADSVQSIQINCLNGSEQPFNITGYTAAVNIYDVSGALADTYVPTIDFANSGILSFDIDTTITGTTGRYTLVVELTSGGDVIQLGPLEVLVRPL